MEGIGIALNLIGWGSHALVPWRLAQGSEASRRRWALAVLPLLLGMFLLTLIRVASQPDVLLKTGFLEPGLSPLGRVMAVVFLAVAGGDAVVLLGRRQLPPLGWRCAAGLGILGLVGACVVAELWRLGSVVETGGAGNVLGASLCRGLLSLGAGELVAPHPPPREEPKSGSLRPLPGRVWSGLAAGLALFVYPLWLEETVQLSLWRNGDIPTLFAASLLIALSPILPRTFRRPSLAAGIILSGFFLARVALLSQPTELPLHYG